MTPVSAQTSSRCRPRTAATASGVSRHLLGAGHHHEQAREHQQQRASRSRGRPCAALIARVTSSSAPPRMRGLGDRHAGEKQRHHRQRHQHRLERWRRCSARTDGVAARGGRRRETRARRTPAITAMTSTRPATATGASAAANVAIGDARDSADDHVLRIAGDGGDAADVRRHRHRQQVGHRIALAAARVTSITSGVITRQIASLTRKAENSAGDDHDRRQQHARRMRRARNAQPATSRKKPESLQMRHHDHHAEQQHDACRGRRPGRPPAGSAPRPPSSGRRRSGRRRPGRAAGRESGRAPRPHR